MITSGRAVRRLTGRPSVSVPEAWKAVEPKRKEEGRMKIVLTQDYSSCLDGIHLSEFRAWEAVDFPAHIAETLLSDGRAQHPEAFHSQEKALPGAPENKMAAAPAENKDEPEPQTGPIRKPRKQAHKK
jgi:hypothetical protein